MGNTHALDELENEWKELMEDRARVRNTFPKGDSKIVLPCNLQRLIWNAQKIFKLNLRKPTNLNPLKIVEGIRELSKKFVIVKGEDKISVQANANATMLMNALIRSTLCSKRVIEEYRLSEEAFDWLLGEVDTRFQQAQVMILWINKTIWRDGFKIDN